MNCKGGGRAKVASLVVDARRRFGRVYTPTPLVRFVIDRALDERGMGSTPILDPACGGGVFLVELTKLIAAALRRRGIEIRGTGRDHLLAELSDRLYGLDVHRDGVESARQAISTTVLDLSPGPLPENFMEGNLCEADFLMDVLPESLPDAFGLVVGNPPYVTTSHLPDAYKDLLRRRFGSASGRIDLYVSFMERASELLLPEGRFAFITPDKFLTSLSAQALRKILMRRGALVSVARFGSHKVFKDAATVPCITVWQKGSEQGPLHLRHCSNGHEEKDVVPTGCWLLPSDRIRTDGWELAPTEVATLVAQVLGDHPPLERFVSRVSAGLATGLHRAFVLGLEEQGLVEPELRWPAVRGKDVEAYQIGEPDLALLVPYRFGEGGSPELLDINLFPRAHSWLSGWREQLESRHCVRVWGKSWYDLHDPVPNNLAATPKILVPDVAKRNRFAYDPGHFIPLHSAYYLVPVDLDPRVLTAILNSPPIEFLVRARAPRVKDAFSRYRRQFLVEIPVPSVSPSTERAIIDAYEEGDTERLDELTMWLFGVSRQHIDEALLVLGTLDAV